MKINIIILFVLCMLFGVSAGCRGTKTVMRFTDNNTSFELNCYPTRAPFSDDPNFYCSLKVPSVKLNTEIMKLLVFKVSDGHWGFVFQNRKRNHALITSESKEPQYIQYNTSAEFISSIYSPLEFDQPSFEVLEHLITIYNVECILFFWHSGSLRYYGFKKFADGLSSFFDYTHIREKKDNSNSGEIHFVKWKKWRPRFLYDWPTIDRIETFDKPKE